MVVVQGKLAFVRPGIWQHQEATKGMYTFSVDAHLNPLRQRRLAPRLRWTQDLVSVHHHPHLINFACFSRPGSWRVLLQCRALPSRTVSNCVLGAGPQGLLNVEFIFNQVPAPCRSVLREGTAQRENESTKKARAQSCLLMSARQRSNARVI